MKGRGNWNKQDIIGLYLFHSVNGPQLRSIVSKYDSLESFCRRGFSKSLFIDDQSLQLQDIREIGNGHICQHYEKGIQVITFACKEYPQSLLHIDYPPPILYVKGQLNEETCMAIIGTRNPTSYGQRVAEKYASTFAQHNICVVSGLAMGIDSIAHKTVVQTHGKTYAVIASGHEKISPKSAQELSLEILEKNGAIISEYPMNVKAKPLFFPRRNRIISGLSSSILIVESGKTGGSMITAQFAFDQNRDVFVVPGSIFSPMSEGNHFLLMKDKAMLTKDPLDMLLNVRKKIQPLSVRHECDMIEHAILQALSNEPVHIDEIQTKTGFTLSILAPCLLQLECRSLIKQLSGMNFIRLTNEFTLSAKT